MGNVIKTQINCSADTLIDRCCDCIGARCAYVSDLEENFKELDKAVKDLEGLKNDVISRIDIEERQGMKRKDQVRRWLSELKLSDIRENLLINGKQKVAKLCIGGCCSLNYFSSYKFGKKVVDTLKEVNNQVAQGREFFKEVATLTLPDPMVGKPSQPTVGLEKNLDIVCSYLLEERVGIVGLYGDGGVGKTALLKQVNNKICSEYNTCFDLLIWIPVSMLSNKENIQNDIGKKIGYFTAEWRNKTFDDKATDILSVLKNKKYVLLLDDVWELVNLVDIGVPLSKPNEGKVVFTTRSEKICYEMSANKIVEVEPLALEESLKLFTAIVGENTFNFNPKFYGLADEIVKECRGVPESLIKMARGMSGQRSIQEWTNAITSLKNPVFPDSLEVGNCSAIDNMIDLGEEDDERDPTMEAKLGDKNVFGNPITDKIVREMPQCASGEQITARHRAKVALEWAMKNNGKEVEAREYVKHLKMKYDDRVSTIGLFYNATGCTLRYSSHKDWYGSLSEGVHPKKVENGQWGVFFHMGDNPFMFPQGGSSGAIVYSGENGFGDKCDWMLAWDNPSAGAQAHPKVFTEVRWKDHFPQWWIVVHNLLLGSGQQHEDTWQGCVSSLTLDDTNGDGPFFKATLSLDFAR